MKWVLVYYLISGEAVTVPVENFDQCFASAKVVYREILLRDAKPGLSDYLNAVCIEPGGATRNVTCFNMWRPPDRPTMNCKERKKN